MIDRVDSSIPAPDGSPSGAESYTITYPAKAFGERGTAILWFKVNRTLGREVLQEVPLISGETLKVRVMSRGDCVYILTDYGSEMTGVDKDGRSAPYRYQSLLTHLKADRWYQAAWTWDVRDSRRNNFYLDGIAQDGPSAYEYPGQLSPARGESRLTVGAEGFTTSLLQVYTEPMTEHDLRVMCRTVGHRAYTDEGVRFDGRRFVPRDVDWDHPVYESSFDSPSALNDWRMEGGFRARVGDGSLILENGPNVESDDYKGDHLVYWLNREMPSDFLLEFTFRPMDRRNGLAIAFFNARGIGGESIFDPSLRPRDGDFAQYHSGDLNSYHISYWAGGRGTANVRKNKGSHLVSIGKDLVTTSPDDEFQTIRIYKRGGQVRLMVDNIVSLSYNDDGKTYGPVHTHSGWIGLRQMSHARRCEYGCMKVYSLKPRG